MSERNKKTLSKLNNYQDKTIIITGAASGIGKELSSLFVKAGARVALFDINRDALEDTAEQLTNTYDRAVFTREVDVTDYNRFKEAVDEVADQIGPIHVFINNAGIGIVGDFIKHTVEEINAITSVNYLGMVYGSHIIVQHFFEQGNGHLVNVASGAGLQGFPRMSLYCGTKAGIITFSQALRFELKRRGIFISVALPSSTDTPMIMNELDGPDDAVPGILMAIPLCKTGQVARAIFNGIAKKKFMIFPTFGDKMALYTRNLAPWLLNFGISQVGFRSFKGKRKRLIKEYGLDK